MSRQVQQQQEFLPVQTPHFFIWITKGEDVPEGQLPLPNNQKFNYLTRLRNECRKLKRTNTPVYLVYKGNLLTKEQRAQMEDLANDPEMSNLFMIDYDGDKFEQWCLKDSTNKADQTFVDRMHESTTAFLSGKKDERIFDGYKKIVDGLGSIAHLIDLTKLFLVYRCDILHQIAMQKYQDDPRRMEFLKSIMKSKGVLYRDFDVALSEDKMRPIKLINGHISSTSVANLLEKRLRQLKTDIEAAKFVLGFERIDPEKFRREMTRYYQGILNDPKKYVRLYLAYNRPETSSPEERMKIESEYLDKSRCISDISRHPIFSSKNSSLLAKVQQDFDSISGKLFGGVAADEHLFYRDLVSAKVTRAENSLIGVAGPRHLGIEREIVGLNNLKTTPIPGYSEVEHGVHTPFSAMQDAMIFPGRDGKGLTRADVNRALVDHIAHCVLNTDMFRVGNHESWKAKKTDLHAPRPTRKVDAPENKTVLTVKFTPAGELKLHPSLKYVESQKQQQDPNILPVTTSHFFVWISDGRKLDKYGKPKISPDELPLLHKGKLNYLETLKTECAKLAKTKTPAYLFYKGDLLTDGQRQKMEDLARQIPNLFVIDYDADNFAQWCLSGSTDPDDRIFVDKIQESVKAFIEQKGRAIGFLQETLGSIGHTVDFIKMFGLSRSDMMHSIAYQKYYDDPTKQEFLPSIQESTGILYRDFDVTLKGEQMQPIRLYDGQISSTTRAGLKINTIEKISRMLSEPFMQIALSERNLKAQDILDRLIPYCDKFFSDPKEYLRKYCAFHLPKTASDEERLAIAKEFDEVSLGIFRAAPDGASVFNKKDSLLFFFKAAMLGEASSLGSENSLIAVSRARHEGFASVKKVTGMDLYDGVEDVSKLDPREKGEIIEYTPYSATQDALMTRLGMKHSDDQVRFESDDQEEKEKYAKYLAHCMDHAEGLFEIGRDQTWIAESMTKDDILDMLSNVASTPQGSALISSLERGARSSA